MKKVFLTLSAIILTISNLVANPVDVDMARKTARGFVNTAFAETSRDNAMDLVLTTDAFYVFNIGQTGFVIVRPTTASVLSWAIPKRVCSPPRTPRLR